MGHFPEDDLATSSRNLIESLARSLSRPRGRTSPPPTAIAGAAALAQTREQFIAANGGQPWGALGMGSPAASPSPSRSPRGRQTASESTSVPPRREWSVSRREWTHAGSTSPAAAVDVLVSSVGDLISTTTSSRSTPSSSRSQSPERRGRAGVAAGDAEPTSTKSSRSRSRSVLAKVRGIMRSSSLSPRGSSSVDLPDVEDNELLLEKESDARA